MKGNTFFSFAAGLLIGLVNLTSSYCIAQTPAQVDLSLRVEVIPPYPWLPGTEGKWLFTAKNESTGATARGVLEALNNTPDTPDQDKFLFLGESCARISECDTFGLLCYDMGFLVAGQSAQCEVRFRAVERRNRRHDAPFVVSDKFGRTIDPNRSNNFVSIRPEVAAFTVQAPISPASYALMALLMVGLGGLAVKRWH